MKNTELNDEDVRRAEALAKTCCERLAPWGISPCVHVEWKTVEKLLLGRQPGDWPAGDENPNRHVTAESEMTWFDRASKLAEQEHEFAWWEAHIELWDKSNPLTRGVESPHAPVLELFRLGLVIDSMRDGTVVLLRQRGTKDR